MSSTPARTSPWTVSGPAGVAAAVVATPVPVTVTVAVAVPLALAVAVAVGRFVLPTTGRLLFAAAGVVGLLGGLRLLPSGGGQHLAGSRLAPLGRVVSDQLLLAGCVVTAVA
jgi:hypothetical protein